MPHEPTRRLSPVLTSGGYDQWQTDRTVGRVTQESWGLSSDGSKWQRRDTHSNTAFCYGKPVEPSYNALQTSKKLTFFSQYPCHLY